MKEDILSLEDIEEVLFKRIENDQFKALKELPSPALFKDIERSTQRIVKAIENKEKINLVGDYDVDGVVSTAVMVEFFSYLGVSLNYIIPNRFTHGYGLSPKILDQIDEGIVITVDNGISAVEAAKICKNKGIDLIITDHHTVGEVLPDAYAIINPKQSDCEFPFKEICGAQVAWYLCANIKKALGVNYNLMELLDLVTLAIVADIMPMVSLNRTMVSAGLKKIESSQRVSLLNLKERLGLKNINEEDIGFKIAPLINCAGRMSDASIALEFLIGKEKEKNFNELDSLISLNEKRKQQQLQMFEEAKMQVDTNDEVVVVSSEYWNEGIIGIVASKLCEKYKKPSLVFSVENGVAKASARSTSDVNLYKLIQSCSDLLNGFGGHKQAAGLSLDSHKLGSLREKLCNNIKQFRSQEEQEGEYLGSFCISMIGESIYQLIESYRPYGITNPYPLFRFNGLEVLSVQKIGKNKEYSKVMVSNGSYMSELLVFIDVDEIFVGEKIDFIAQISRNDFRNKISYSLLLKELLKGM